MNLTAAGDLPPAIVSKVFEELDLGREWIGKGNREDLTVLALREAGQRLKLVRKYKGRLVPTSQGRSLADDPVGLWWHVAGALPLGGCGETDAEWQSGVLLLALMAAGSTGRWPYGPSATTIGLPGVSVAVRGVWTTDELRRARASTCTHPPGSRSDG